MWVWRVLHSKTYGSVLQEALSVARPWNSVVLTIHPTQAARYLLEQRQCQLQKPTQEGIALLWFSVTRRAAFHHSPVTCDWTWGVPTSDPKILRGALPFVEQMTYTTKDCHIIEACWHNWDFNPPLCLVFVQRAKIDTGGAQYNATKGRQNRFLLTTHGRKLRLLDLKPNRK